MSKFLYGMLLLVVAELNPELKESAHYQSVHPSHEFLQLNNEQLKQVGFIIDESSFIFSVQDKASQRVFHLSEGRFQTRIDHFKENENVTSKMTKRNYYPVLILGNYDKILYNTNETKDNEMMPILLTSNVAGEKKYYLYLFRYTKEMQKVLPAGINPKKYLLNYNDIKTII